MTNLGRTKNLITSVFFLFFISGSIAQGNYLKVPVYGQENTLWCWAASLEMVLEYHGMSTETQCDLAELYQIFQMMRTNPSPTLTVDQLWKCCNAPCVNEHKTEPFPKPSGAIECNHAIKYSKRDGTVDLHYMDLILSSLGYNSTEDTDTGWMDWDNIKNEIDFCRPFIIFLNKLSNSSGLDAYNHAVVAKGYYQYGDAQYVLINDPQDNIKRPCQGCEFLLPINIFTDPTPELSSALEIVKTIHKKDVNPCDSCKVTNRFPTNSSDLVSGIETILGTGVVPGTDFFDLNDLEINSSELSGFLSATSAGLDLFDENNITYSTVTSSTTKNAKILVSLTTAPRIALILDEKIASSTWAVKGITLADCTPFTERVEIAEIDGEPDPTSIPSGEFDIIEYMPDFFQFYKFKQGRHTYLSPVKTYPLLPYKEQHAYKEEEVTKFLQELIEKRENPTKKKCFLSKIFKKKN